MRTYRNDTAQHRGAHAPPRDLKRGDRVHRTGRPYCIATIMRIEHRGAARICHVVGIPEHLEPFADEWPLEECVFVTAK